MNYVSVDEEKSAISVSEEKASLAGAPLAIGKDVMLADIETEKRLALIKAWEESEKTKAANRAYKRMSAVELWEHNKRTSVEAQLRKIEKFERKKVEYAKIMKNKVAKIHNIGEEKRREHSLMPDEEESLSRWKRKLQSFVNLDLHLEDCFGALTCAKNVLLPQYSEYTMF